MSLLRTRLYFARFLSHLGLFVALVLISACSVKYPNREPLGEVFPRAQGESLEKVAKTLPDMFAGEKVVLLLGYVQDAQFDIDRWLIGLDQTATQVQAYEIPTIRGMAPRMFKEKIDEGMRRGIPKEIWGGVITVYKDGDKIQRFTGNQNPNNARVLLLDEQGRILYYHDRGFSVGALNLLRETLDESSPRQAGAP